MRANRKKVELAMARACMNTKDIAEESGMPEQTVKNVLYGRSVKPRTLGKFAKAIGVDPAEIIKEEQNDN